MSLYVADAVCWVSIPRYSFVQVVSDCSPTNFRDGANGESASDQFSRVVKSATVIPGWLSSHRLDSRTVALPLGFAIGTRVGRCGKDPACVRRWGGSDQIQTSVIISARPLSTGEEQGRRPETCFSSCRSWLRLNRRSKSFRFSSLRSRLSGRRLISSPCPPPFGRRQPRE